MYKRTTTTKRFDDQGRKQFQEPNLFLWKLKILPTNLQISIFWTNENFTFLCKLTFNTNKWLNKKRIHYVSNYEAFFRIYFTSETFLESENILCDFTWGREHTS